MKFSGGKLTLLVVILLGMLLLSGAVYAADEMNIKMSYNGPADIKTNPVHAYAVRFKEFVEAGTNGRITITLYPNSQLGNEQQRMEQTINGPMINIASNAGMVSVYPEIYAATLPFMFNSYRAAHIFFDKSEYWEKTKADFQEKTGVVLLEAIEEGGFLAFTNSKKEIHSPADFKGLKFRAMDAGQVALYEAFGASGTPIAWTEVYMALQTGVADGQMNPPTYIISGSLYEVQDYMTLANIQYSCQWLTINGTWFESLSPEDRYIIKEAAHAANIINRLEVEAQVEERIQFIKDHGVKVYQPTAEELKSFRDIGQPAYNSWIKKKVAGEWIDLALESARLANQEVAADE